MVTLLFLTVCFIEPLGDASFRRREVAVVVLAKNLGSLLPLIEGAEVGHPSLEVRRRCTRVLLSLTEAPMPFINRDDPGCWEYIGEARAAGFVHSTPPYLAYREATRLWLIDRITQRLPWRATLRRWWAEEVRWHVEQNLLLWRL